MMPRKYELGTQTYSFAVDRAERNKFVKKNKLMRNDMLRAAMVKINNTLPDE